MKLVIALHYCGSRKLLQMLILFLLPKGTGAVKVTGNFVISDQTFILEDAQGPKARFEVSNIGTGTNTRIFTLPAITSGNGTTVVGDNTTQTLTNKTIALGSNTVTGALANGITATTQSASDNSTKVATTAYVDNQVSAGCCK